MLSKKRCEAFTGFCVGITAIIRCTQNCGTCLIPTKPINSIMTCAWPRQPKKGLESTARTAEQEPEGVSAPGRDNCLSTGKARKEKVKKQGALPLVQAVGPSLPLLWISPSARTSVSSRNMKQIEGIFFGTRKT